MICLGKGNDKLSFSLSRTVYRNVMGLKFSWREHCNDLKEKIWLLFKEIWEFCSHCLFEVMAWVCGGERERETVREGSKKKV